MILNQTLLPKGHDWSNWQHLNGVWGLDSNDVTGWVSGFWWLVCGYEGCIVWENTAWNTWEWWLSLKNFNLIVQLRLVSSLLTPLKLPEAGTTVKGTALNKTRFSINAVSCFSFAKNPNSKYKRWIIHMVYQPSSYGVLLGHLEVWETAVTLPMPQKTGLIKLQQGNVNHTLHRRCKSGECFWKHNE